MSRKPAAPWERCENIDDVSTDEETGMIPGKILEI